MKILGVIPARYGSTRLEGKPLMDICGKTMIERVYRRAKKSNLDRVIVATDDERIACEVEKFGEVVMTSKNHKNGTSRICEVIDKIKGYDVVINIQGDEPLIEPEMINTLIEVFKKEDIPMATLKYKLDNLEDIKNPNFVKVVVDKDDNAIYFSRSPIPYPREMNIDNYYKHIGIYGYKTDFVKKYMGMPQAPLEKSESLEQLRVLENGYKIKVLETKYKILGVDTLEDLENVRKYIEKNKIELEKDDDQI